jgi:hypothetical protein
MSAVRPVHPFATLLLLGLVVPVLVGCEGMTVDRQGTSFVDRESAGGFDRETAPDTLEEGPRVRRAGDEGYREPPTGIVGPSPIPAPSGMASVTLWVWDARSARKATVPLYSGITLDAMGVTVDALLIDRAEGIPTVSLALDRRRLPPLAAGEQVTSGGVTIHIVDVTVP